MDERGIAKTGTGVVGRRERRQGTRKPGRGRETGEREEEVSAEEEYRVTLRAGNSSIFFRLDGIASNDCIESWSTLPGSWFVGVQAPNDVERHFGTGRLFFRRRTKLITPASGEIRRNGALS